MRFRGHFQVTTPHSDDRCMPTTDERLDMEETKIASSSEAAGNEAWSTLGESLRAWAERSGEAVAVCDAGEELSYDELLLRSRRFASGLASAGLNPGDTVVFQPPNRAVSLALLFGLVLRGCIPVLALANHREAEVAHMLRTSGAKALFVPDKSSGYDFHELAASMKDEFPNLRVYMIGNSEAERTVSELDSTDDEEALSAAVSSDVLFLLLSGGTTGLPKLIPRTHASYLGYSRACSLRQRFGPHTRFLAALSMSHNFTLSAPGILGTLDNGGTVIMSETASPDEAFPLVSRFKANFVPLVPALVRLWADAITWFPCDFSSLEVLCVGGAAFSQEDADRAQEAFGCSVQQVYGMTEGLAAFTSIDDPEWMPMSSGSPISEQDEALIVAADGGEAPAGREGRLLWKGPFVMDGYYRNDQANRESFTPDGYFITGDLAVRDKYGHLHITGRVKNVITRAGESISAEEIENVLRRMPGVAEAGVCGVPDEKLGECTCAFIVPKGAKPSLEEVRAFFAEEKAATYKHPDKVVHLRSIPLLPTGKLDVKALLSMLP